MTSNAMPFDKESVTLGGAGLGLLGWASLWIYRIIRSERAHNRADAAQSDVIATLREELDRQAAQIVAKEGTIVRLIKEKSELMEKLAELPALTVRIGELEEQIQAMLKLFDHLIQSGALQLGPEHQTALISLFSNVLHKGIDNDKQTR